MGIPDLDQANAELEQATSPPAEGGVEPQTDETAAPPTLRETLEAAAKEAREPTQKPAADDRVRDASGRFVAKADGDSPATESPPGPSSAPKSASAPISPTTQPEPPAAVSTPPAGPPPGWSPEAKAEFTKLSPAIQAAVIKREAEVGAGFAQYAQAKKELEQVVAPRRLHYASQGVSDTQAINNLWTWFEALQRTPSQSFPALAELFGFDLSTVNPGAPASQSQQVSPEIGQLRAHVRGLEQQLGQVAGTFEQQQMTARQQELAAFAKDKPHFERVRVTMGKLMQAGTAQTLDDAYQQATRIDPTVSAEIQAADKAAADKAAAEAALKMRPANQRRAAVSVRGSAPNGAAGTAQPTGIRESLRQGFAEARGS